MDINTILVIVGIVVLIGVAGGCIFAIMKLRGLITMMDTKLSPKLDELKDKTAAIVPAVEQAGPLMESVNVTIDAIDTELVKLDGTLDKVSHLTGSVVSTAQAVPQVASEAKRTIKAGLTGKR